MLDGRRVWRRLTGVPPLVADTIIVIGLTAVTVVLGIHYTDVPLFGHFDAYDGWAMALTLLITVPLVFRRRYPLLVLLLICLGYEVYLLANYVPSLNIFPPLIALYSVASVRPARVTAIAALLVGGTVYHSGSQWQYDSRPMVAFATSAAQAVIAVSIAWIFGTASRRLTESNERLFLLAAQLRWEQERQARHAVTEERLRIARELHDVVAHHMSVVSVQAGLARYVLPGDPFTAAGALTIIADTSHEALDEMRRMLGVLRVGETDQPDDYDPSPGLARLPELVARVVAAGVPVETVVTGPQRPLPPGTDLCAYRVIQESLTNVLKHAMPATATVELHYGFEELTLRVVNTGRPSAPRPEAQGHGLIGMRERSRIYGGRVTAGALPDGGFEVSLVLPTTADPR